MKLKEATRIAKKKGYKWIAVDALDYIRAYKKEPFIKTTYNQWGAYIDWPGSSIIIGTYSGKKWWTNTKMES